MTSAVPIFLYSFTLATKYAKIEGISFCLPLAAVVDKGRQNDIPSIFAYFTTQVKEYKKIGTAFVTSAVELTSAQQTRVKEKLLATTRYVEFEMNYNVDPSLIGGMIIRIGDRVVDSSIKTQLYELKRELLNVQLV